MTKGHFNNFQTTHTAKKIIFLEEIGSTNDYAKDLAKATPSSGLAVIASAQTAGRGRLGRSWDGDGDNIYMSVILKPEKNPAHLTLMAGVCVARVLSTFLVNTKYKALIKWPNDIVVDGKKICGILTEGGSFGAVIGIGINVSRESFPRELADKGTSLRMLTGICHERADIIKLLLSELSDCYERFIQGGIGSFIDEYKKLCLNIGRTVTIHEPNSAYEAICIDITDNGELLVEVGAGERRALNSGEVSVKGIYGSDV